MRWDNDTKRFMIHRLTWLLIFMGVGIVLVFLLPFPFDLISIAGLFFLITFLRGRSEMRKFGGTSGLRNLFGSFSSSMYDNQSSPLKYYCMNCGKEHNEVAFPNCGSKMKRIQRNLLMVGEMSYIPIRVEGYMDNNDNKANN